MPLEHMVVHPGPTAVEEDDAELVLGKGAREEKLLSLIAYGGSGLLLLMPLPSSFGLGKVSSFKGCIDPY